MSPHPSLGWCLRALSLPNVRSHCLPVKQFIYVQGLDILIYISAFIIESNAYIYWDEHFSGSNTVPINKNNTRKCTLFSACHAYKETKFCVNYKKIRYGFIFKGVLFCFIIPSYTPTLFSNSFSIFKKSKLFYVRSGFVIRNTRKFKYVDERWHAYSPVSEVCFK